MTELAHFAAFVLVLLGLTVLAAFCAELVCQSAWKCGEYLANMRGKDDE